MNKIKYYQLQLEAGLSNSEAANFLGVSPSSIRKWRSGQHEAPQAVIMCLLSKAQNKPVDKVKHE